MINYAAEEKKNVNSIQTKNKNRKSWKENINFIDHFLATFFFHFFYFYFFFLNLQFQLFTSLK